MTSTKNKRAYQAGQQLNTWPIAITLVTFIAAIVQLIDWIGSIA
jgi:hypothetical protein